MALNLPPPPMANLTPEMLRWLDQLRQELKAIEARLAALEP